LALSLPLLVLLVLGCVDFGRFATSHIAVTNAARAGAGFGSFNPYLTSSNRPRWEAGIRQAILDEMSGLKDFDANQLTVPTPVVTTENGGMWRVQVEVRYPFQSVIPWPGLPTNLTLKSVVVMRAIRY
jgi:hypothetical protein